MWEAELCARALVSHSHIKKKTMTEGRGVQGGTTTSSRVPIIVSSLWERVLRKTLLSYLGHNVEADCGECGTGSRVLDEAWGVVEEGG